MDTFNEVEQFLQKEFSDLKKTNIENSEKVEEEVRASNVTSVPTAIIDGIPTFDGNLVTFEQLYSLFSSENKNCTL